MHEDGALRDVPGIVGVMADHQHRESAITSEAIQQIEHFLPQCRPEGGEGLIQKQHRAAAHQGAGQRHPLPLASG